MKKVTILALHLGYGGIERAISTLANSLVNNYYVEIVSTYKLYDEPVFKLNKKICVKYLMNDLKPNKKELINSIKKFKIANAFKEFNKSLKILKLKKKLMIEYIKNCDSDVIISTRYIHNEWLGKYGKNKSLKIAWEHNHHQNNQKFISKVINSVKNIDYFVLVSKDLKNFYENKCSCKCIYIPNSISISNDRSPLTDKRIISIGRLSKEKGFDDLIRVFKIVSDKYSDWKLDIVGDGNEYEKIKQLISDNKLENKVALHGFQNKDYINELLLKSSIYVMTSFTESFGIVLIEAFSYGIPCIAFDSAEGANEIISDNWNGYLIKDRNIDFMAKRIGELIKNSNRRQIMGDNAYKDSLEYDSSKINNAWINLIEQKY